MTNKFREVYKKIIEDVSFSELTEKEKEQLLNYLWIFKSNNFVQHWEVNEYINKHVLWDKFTELRSLNDHGHYNKVKGITPKFFAIACASLDVRADNGNPLEEYEKY